MRYLTFFFMLSLEIWCMFILAHLNSDDKFSLKYLASFRFHETSLTFGEVDSYTQVVSSDVE